MRKIIIALLMLAANTMMAQQTQIITNDRNATNMRKLQIAEYLINHMYVDKVDETKLVEDAIKGMLNQLDPHSTYATPEEVKRFNEPLKGSFDGIGVQFNMAEDTLLVIQTESKGPSEKVGILPGDRIVMVNDTAIAGVKMPKEDIMKRLRGPRGTKVKIGIVRRGVSGIADFIVTRAQIPVTTVDAYYMITPEIGYLKFGSFGLETIKEVHNALTALSKKGMKKLIIDLQGNGGGFLNAAVDITNEFLAKDEMIVYTHGRAVRNESFKANGEGKYQKIPLVVLVDEYSASAAEILTGAIQDHDRGLVVGRRTFGKGLVQRPIDLPDGSMIRLTVAHYYTPSGRCIQKPYEKGNSEDYHKDIIHRFNKGEFTNIDSIHLVDSLKFTTLKQKRTVYGGGGIMPDYFIPLDTMKYARYHREVAAHSVLYNVVLQYIDKNRKSMNSKYPNFKAFMKKYDETEKILKEIREKAAEQKITCTDDEWTKAKESLALQVKALVARDLFDMSEYFEIMNANNATVQKAIELLSKK